MLTSETTLAAVNGTGLTLGNLLRFLHLRRRLRPLVAEALVAQLLLAQARQAGLATTAAERQAAADAFRRRHGLDSADATHKWFDAQGLSVDDFEEVLEHDVLSARFRDHLTAVGVDSSFQAASAGFERLRLTQLLVRREDLAKEVASQVRDEGRNLEAVAAEQGLQVVQGELFQKDLEGPLAEALAGSPTAELVGPVGTQHGFVLVVVEERHPAALDAATRRRIQDELFVDWLHARMNEVTFEPLPREPS
jgi:parvulin-like peptidyl-prolyl isomerase